MVEFYFDGRNGSYWLRNGAQFVNLDTAQLKLHLRRDGLSKDVLVDQNRLNELEKAVVVAQLERCVDYAGPLAGRQPGHLKLPTGRQILVTSGPSLPVAKKGTTDRLDDFLSSLAGTQVSVVLHWLKCARASLVEGDYRPGQLLVLAGPSGCGKSLFQALVTEWLGGRSAKPYRYMIGETSFNSDLAGAEHWIIEDEHSSTDIRTRRKFGASLKEATVNRELSIHAKGKQALSLPVFRRVTLSVNDEPENLMILPPMDPSIIDKVTLVRCSPAKVSPNREKTWRELTRELPALAWALERMTVPRSDTCPRYGVKAQHDRVLLDVLSGLAPEQRLLNLIDETVLAGTTQLWAGSAEELEQALRSGKFGFAVDKLLYFYGAAATYLGRLAAKYPHRVRVDTASGRPRWCISRVTG